MALIFNNVSFSYDKENHVFNDLSFNFSNPNLGQGHIISLMGSSGSGKSTLLKLILGTLQPQSGNITFDFINPIISYLPQEPILFEHLNPLENARYFEKIKAYKNSFDNNLFLQLSKKLGMHEILKKSNSVNELSGGQKQRISALRALSIKPHILLLDEPTNGLDADIKLNFLQEIRKIVVEQNILAIYITHHKSESEIISDEVAYLYSLKNSTTKSIVIKESNQFCKNPPVLEAFKVFNYPNAGIIRCKWQNNLLSLASGSDNDFFYIGFDKENIVLNNDIGFDYEILSSNQISTFLKLSNNDVITVSTDSMIGSKVLIKGKLLKYNDKTLFEEILNID